MDANEIQIGGNHYKGKEYQHWDWVCDTNLHYLLACATKYVSRWRDKNGIQDLQKASHYISKADEQGVVPPVTQELDNLTIVFCNQFGAEEANIISLICCEQYQLAQNAISNLVLANIPEATSKYVDQD